NNLDTSKQGLEPLLAGAVADGTLVERRDLWIINGIALTAYPELIQSLLTQTDVTELRIDHYEQYIEPEPEILPRSSDAEEPEYPWGLTRIRAQEVWETLGITGTGIVIAGMDTGAEYNHPALANNYRGNLGNGLYNHTNSWFDAINESPYPYDDHGHGTHTLGTAAGHEGIGVAPGAQWIGVKILSGNGGGYNSWIHAGFQWLLAPGGDPNAAPDIVNCSWSSANARDRTFEDDIAVLKAAGILPIFAAGNNGPDSKTVGAPASLKGVLAVGASDPDDEIAASSGRGPSPWNEYKPYVSAPGVKIYSSVPGGIYQEWSGTSMATPHVAGIAALMRSAAPSLSVDRIIQILKKTAVPLGAYVPNNDEGWGRVDAFAALIEITEPAIITGVVRGTGNVPLANVHVEATPMRPDGNAAHDVTDENGKYFLAMPATKYNLTASAFGHYPQTKSAIEALTGTATQVDFALPALPGGVVEGHITVGPSHSAPPTHPVEIHIPSISVVVEPDAATGYYAVALPAGTYTLTVKGNGYRVVTEQVTIETGLTVAQDFNLQTAPLILVVDEGAWYYESQVSYWYAALEELDYTADEVRIKHVPDDTPLSSTLMAYDVVLWSSPQGSPGLVLGGEALGHYLEEGGKLLLSGQDIAYYDGGGYPFTPRQSYLTEQLAAYFDSSTLELSDITGLGPFEGLTVTITGEDGADNQESPDTVGIRDESLTQPLWRYSDGRYGGVSASICVPYKALYFAFGYESIAGTQKRLQILSTALDWLAAPPPTSGLAKKGAEDTLIGLPGQRLTHTLYIRHIGMAGTTDTVTVQLSGHRWPAEVYPTTAAISPCETLTYTVVTTIPLDTGIHVADAVTLTFTSALSPDELVTRVRTKTPAPILLVDDERWYQMEDVYKTALDIYEVPYDIWSTKHEIGGLPGTSSPATETLAPYAIVLWYTGQDWYDPVNKAEIEVLRHYLDNGGRLLLSSQDFLYRNSNSALRERFGVLDWYEDLLPPQTASGVPDHPAGGTWGPAPLEFISENYGDALEPVPDAAPVTRGQDGQVTGIAQEGITQTLSWRTLFYGFPIETLPAETLAQVLSRAVGWLSPLGNSTWELNPQIILDEHTITGTHTIVLPQGYVTATAILRNDAPEPFSTELHHTLPTSFVLLPGSLSPGLAYDEQLQEISWAGIVQPGEPITLSWVTLIGQGMPSGAVLRPTLEFTLADWGLRFEREKILQIAGSDLSSSRWLSPTGGLVRPMTLYDFGFVLRNTGAGPVEDGYVNVWTMRGINPAIQTEEQPPTHGLSLTAWQGDLAPGETRYITIPLTSWKTEGPVRFDALLGDKSGQRWEQSVWLEATMLRVYLPVVMKD
ncbi:MAG: S8 family serine peptidase, partial [Anaerolineae bacterium]|nr:S8 family serine peptidase [Anaerolineae bacterium]